MVAQMLITQSVFFSLLLSSRCLASIFNWAVKYFFIASLFLDMLLRIDWCWSVLGLMCRAFVQSDHWVVFKEEIGKVGRKAVIRL